MEGVISNGFRVDLLLLGLFLFLSIKLFLVAAQKEKVLKNTLGSSFNEKDSIDCVPIEIEHSPIPERNGVGMIVCLINKSFKRLKIAQKVKESFGLDLTVILAKNVPYLAQKVLLHDHEAE